MRDTSCMSDKCTNEKYTGKSAQIQSETGKSAHGTKRWAMPTGKSAHGTGHEANDLDESSKVAHVGVQWGM